MAQEGAGLHIEGDTATITRGPAIRAPGLSANEVETFRRDGIVVIRQAFDPLQAGRFGSWAEELLAQPETPGHHWVYWEESRKKPGAKIVCRIENIIPYHPGFAALTEALAPSVEQLLGEPAVLFKEKINFKQPGGGGFKPHQDAQAGWDAYADFFISAVVSIDKTTAENGCLQVAAGHHRQGLFRQWEPLTEADMEGMTFVDCPTEPGDIIFFDSFAPHASEANLSDQQRRMFFATYNRRSAGDHLAQYYSDKKESYPPDIERIPGKTYAFRV